MVGDIDQASTTPSVSNVTWQARVAIGDEVEWLGAEFAGHRAGHQAQEGLPSELSAERASSGEGRPGQAPYWRRGPEAPPAGRTRRTRSSGRWTGRPSRPREPLPRLV